MTAQIEPGQYIRKRRLAAGKRIARQPRALAFHLKDIEAGRVCLTMRDAVVLEGWLGFDMRVLLSLVREKPARICRVCACSQWDPCIADLDGAGSCHWVGPDLCSACTDAGRSSAAPPSPSPTPITGKDL